MRTSRMNRAALASASVSDTSVPSRRRKSLLTATVSPVSRSRALRTSPMAPRPSTPRSSNRPAITSELSIARPSLAFPALLAQRSLMNTLRINSSLVPFRRHQRAARQARVEQFREFPAEAGEIAQCRAEAADIPERLAVQALLLQRQVRDRQAARV